MKNPLKHPIFLISISVYLILFVLKKAQVYLPFISDYLADFLTLPVVLSLSLAVIRKVNPIHREFQFSWHHVLVGVVFFGFMFEWLFPRLTDRFTADPWDLLAYSLGGLLYYFCMRK